MNLLRDIIITKKEPRKENLNYFSGEVRSVADVYSVADFNC